jgi:fatty-acyl-CoA synthase
VDTVGQPLEQTELKIADGRGKPLPCGQTGEISIRGFGVMLGYLDAPGETAKAIDSQGWLRTGDLGEMDSRGYVRITGRVKEMIIRGGENLYPREIEDRIIEHPDVAEVAVIGIPDAHWGEEVVAFVRPMPQTSPTPESLAAALVGRLAPNKIPRHWRLVEAMPTTASGKIQKFVLRESFTRSSDSASC